MGRGVFVGLYSGVVVGSECGGCLCWSWCGVEWGVVSGRVVLGYVCGGGEVWCGWRWWNY